jgi:hypothetical protein
MTIRIKLGGMMMRGAKTTYSEKTHPNANFSTISHINLGLHSVRPINNRLSHGIIPLR